MFTSTTPTMTTALRNSVKPRNEKAIPQLNAQEKQLFGRIEQSAQQMTKQDLKALMGLVQ